MKLPRALLRLPLRVPLAPSLDELHALPEAAWQPHPEGFVGNSALPLIDGAHQETPALAAMPQLRRTLVALGCPLGRVRLMRLAPGAQVREHVDVDTYWWDHLRLHIPLTTHTDVQFYCGYSAAHMAAGEAWVFDTWRPHRVVNGGPAHRVHLVCDTVGSPALWRLIDRALEGDERLTPLQELAPRDADLVIEAWRPPERASTAQLRTWKALLFDDEALQGVGHDLPIDAPLRASLDELLRRWSALSAQWGDAPEGLPHFTAARDRAALVMQRFVGLRRLRNHLDPVQIFITKALRAAAPGPLPELSGAPPNTLDRPVLICCPPRSGSGLLFETLCQAPEVYSIGEESHTLVEGLPGLHPAARGFHSNALSRSEATPERAQGLREGALRAARDRDGSPPPPDAALRFVEKTPKSCLRLPFMAQALPDARLVVLLRPLHQVLSSMLDGWRSDRFITYPHLPGWSGPEEGPLRWSFLLVPGWRELDGQPLWRVVAEQLRQAMLGLVAGLRELRALGAPRDHVVFVRYQELLDDPQGTMLALCGRLDLRWDLELSGPLPLSRTTLTPPSDTKWERSRAEVERALPLVEDVARELAALASSTELSAR